MTPLDRAALADALASATAETLREDAEICRSALAHAGNDRTAASLRRLAALALACAEWSERPTRLTPFDNSWDDDSVTPMPWALRVPMTMAYTHHRTLPAALAALLKGDQ